MKSIKRWMGPVLGLAVCAGALGGLSWYVSRPISSDPAVLDPAELTAAETIESYPGTELSLELNDSKIDLIFWNNSDAAIDHDGSPSVDIGVEVLLDGTWYEVPCENYATGGVDRVTGPGETFRAKPILDPYGKLPDGQYRISFGYWCRDPASEGPLRGQPCYKAYARFDVARGRCALPTEAA